MIEKDKDSLQLSDKFQQAGYEAEKQMAFYLRRAFADSTDFFVYNDLRIERKGEFAQIDHLVLHRFGLVIVESKSVTGTIEVNAKCEFVRVYNGQRRGMQSPVQQAKLQSDLLRAILNDNRTSLRRKVMWGTVQGEFSDERFRQFVGSRMAAKFVAAKSKYLNLPRLMQSSKRSKTPVRCTGRLLEFRVL